MRTTLAFIKKEMTDQLRSGKITVLGILFVLFGIMNPAVAKLTPWLLETLSDSMPGGMSVGSIEVSAMDSWVQFFKNMPMALIAFVLLEGGIFTKEYSSGTLILSLTKGLDRYKVVISKTAVLTLIWSVGYWLCFVITCAYNEYYWDNSIARNLTFSALCWWIFGLWIIALLVIFSTVSGSISGVLLGTGGAVFASYLLAIIPKVNKYLPTLLSDGNSLIYGVSEPKTYIWALIITLSVSVLCFALAIPAFNKKQL